MSLHNFSRNAAITLSIHAGESVKELISKYKISRARAYQIYHTTLSQVGCSKESHPTELLTAIREHAPTQLLQRCGKFVGHSVDDAWELKYSFIGKYLHECLQNLLIEHNIQYTERKGGVQ